MDDRRLVRMQVRKSIKKLVRPKHHPAHRKRFLRHLDPLRQIVTGDVFHHEILLLAFTEVIANLRKHWVTHSGECPRLALKRVSEHLITGKKSSLEGNCTAEALIDREINLAHSTFTNQMNDQITALDQSVRGKRFHFQPGERTDRGNSTYIFQQ